MLKHVSHRSTASLGEGAGSLQVGSVNRRASAPTRPFTRQTSEGGAYHLTASVPSAYRRATHTGESIALCIEAGISPRRCSNAPDVRLKRQESEVATCAEAPIVTVNTPPPPKPATPKVIQHKLPPEEPPPRLGRSLSTPAGCRYVPQLLGSSPPTILPAMPTPPDSPRYRGTSSALGMFSSTPAVPEIETPLNQASFNARDVPEAPRSSTLPRRPMTRVINPTQPLHPALSYSSLPPGGRTSLSARSSSTSSLSETIVGSCHPGSGASKVSSY